MTPASPAPQPDPIPAAQPEPTPTTENKSGGNPPTRIATRPAPRKKGLLDRIEDWLTRN